MHVNRSAPRCACAERRRKSSQRWRLRRWSRLLVRGPSPTSHGHATAPRRGTRRSRPHCPSHGSAPRPASRDAPGTAAAAVPRGDLACASSGRRGGVDARAAAMRPRRAASRSRVRRTCPFTSQFRAKTPKKLAFQADGASAEYRLTSAARSEAVGAVLKYRYTDTRALASNQVLMHHPSLLVVGTALGGSPHSARVHASGPFVAHAGSTSVSLDRSPRDSPAPPSGALLEASHEPCVLPSCVPSPTLTRCSASRSRCAASRAATNMPIKQPAPPHASSSPVRASCGARPVASSASESMAVPRYTNTAAIGAPPIADAAVYARRGTAVSPSR
eukprot:scaffold84261_cov75-Phaeocystis_antarctica.AAC.2